MPKPRSDESREQFLSRCMGDSEAINSFPRQDQRYAFCNSQWDNRNKMKSLPTTHAELEALKTKKINSFYKVNDSFETVTKDVDFNKRIVQSIANTYLYFDSDFDVLMP